MATRFRQKRPVFSSEVGIYRMFTKFSTVVVILCLLMAVNKDRLSVAGQWDCPVTSSQYCSCQLLVASTSYNIECRTNLNASSFFASIGDVMVISQATTMTTIFDSISFDATTIQIGKLGSSAFNGLRVRKIQLSGVGIKLIDPKTFVGVGPELVELLLDNNSLESLPVDTLNQLPMSAVQTISLTNNKLTELRLGTFGSSLSSVQWLYLSENQLTTISDSLFVNLTSLLGLWLNGNLLTSISENTFLGMTQLVWIDLSGNQLASVSAQAFASQPLLERMTLEDNRLDALSAGLLATMATANTTRNGPVELVDFSGNQLTTLPVNDLISLVSSRSDSSYFYVGLAGNSWNCSNCNLIALIRQLSSVSTGTDEAFCRSPPSAVNEMVGCYTLNRCTFLKAIPDYCSSTVRSSSTLQPSTVSLSPVDGSGGSGVNIGIVVGVIVGVLIVVSAAVAIGVYCYFRKRQQREQKVSNFNNFTDIGSENNGGEDGSSSTLKLMYRLGESRRFANQPLFDSNVKTIQATAAAKNGAGNGAQGQPSGVDGEAAVDGGPDEETEDVSVAAKAGLKTVMNTNIVSQNFGKISEC